MTRDRSDAKDANSDDIVFMDFERYDVLVFGKLINSGAIQLLGFYPISLILN